MILKHLFTTLAVVLSLTVSVVLSSCSSSSFSSEENTQIADTASYTELSDTLSRLYGTWQGYNILSQMKDLNLDSMGYDTESYLQGLSLAINTRQPMIYVSGLKFGVQIASDASFYNQHQTKIEEKSILRRLTASFNKEVGNVSSDSLQRLQSQFKALVESDIPPVSVDSLSAVYARMMKTMLNNDIQAYEKATAKNFDNSAFLSGVEKILDRKQSRSEFLDGAGMSVSLAEDVVVLEACGVNLHRDRILAAISDIIRRGVIDENAKQMSFKTMNEIKSRLQKEKYDREDAELAQSPQAIQNLKTGEALVLKMKKSTPEAQTSASGLTYVIYSEGKVSKTVETDSIKFSFSAMRLDGKVFLSDTCTVMAVSDLIPGLKEGLSMLGKGGKARFWVPGNLAYRGHGLPQAGIGPMETIVYDVEIK